MHYNNRKPAIKTFAIDEIRTNSNMFAILADETRDVSNCEQLCICIRWVD